LNSTITQNRVFSANLGGGIFSGAGAVTVLKNTIVAGNIADTILVSFADDINGTVATASSFNNLIGTGGAGGLKDGINSNQVAVDSMLVLEHNLADNGGPTPTYALIAGGPAINAGNNNLIPAGVLFDQRGTGFARISGGAVDIGAFEFQSTVNVTSQVRLLWPASYVNVPLGSHNFRGVFTVTNNSGKTLKNVQLSWPKSPAGISIVSSTKIASLAPGASATISVVFLDLSAYPLGSLKLYFPAQVVAGEAVGRFS